MGGDSVETADVLLVTSASHDNVLLRKEARAVQDVDGGPGCGM